MVEGHGVHRVAALHRKRLVGKKFRAWSPNGRFVEGAKKIDGKEFRKIEAVGKNLFAFFGGGDDDGGRGGGGGSPSDGEDDDEEVVVHVHFGMAGNWAVYHDTDVDPPPSPRPTNRLRLESTDHTIADLHAMTVEHGTLALYDSKRSKLGEDPLRPDADPDRLWTRLERSKKSIGALVNDQAYFTGPGNIYRAEILYKAGIHPDRLGNELSRPEFDRVWHHAVDLLRRGYETGSILTVDPSEAEALGKPHLRRYVYNSSSCPRCGANVKTWDIAGRTCYACVVCQPLRGDGAAPCTPELVGSGGGGVSDCVPFNSHCARESVARRLADGGAERLTVKELRAELSKRGGGTRGAVPKGASKKELLELFRRRDGGGERFVSSEDAAAEKAVAGESLAVEHVAELAPGQARTARARANGGGGKVKKEGKKMRSVKVEESDSNTSGRSNKKRRDKKTKAVKMEGLAPRPGDVLSSNVRDVEHVTVFVSSKRAAVRKSAVGTIPAVNPHSRSTDEPTADDVTVSVSSEHAAIGPAVVGKIAGLVRTAADDGDRNRKTQTEERDVGESTVPRSKAELDRGGIESVRRSTKATTVSSSRVKDRIKKRKRRGGSDEDAADNNGGTDKTRKRRREN